MRATPILLGLGLLAPALLATQPNRESVAFRPAEGTQLKRTFAFTQVSDLDSMEMLMNGEPFPMAPEIDMTVTFEHKLVVTDKLGASEGGRPKSLVRTYETIAQGFDVPMSMEVMGNAEDLHMQGEGRSALEGKQVTFTLKDDEYTKAFVDHEGDVELLEGLLEDLDLRGFLPSGEVSEGDSWDVDPRKVVEVFFAGGDLSIRVESTGDESPMGGGVDQFPPPQDLWQELEGSKVTATFKSVRSEGDQRLAVIELDVQLEATADMTEFMAETLEEQMPEGISAEVTNADGETAFEGKGTLLWDLSAGHAVSLVLEGESVSANSQAFSIDAGGQQMEMSQTMEQSGTMKLEVTFE